MAELENFEESAQVLAKTCPQLAPVHSCYLLVVILWQLTPRTLSPPGFPPDPFKEFWHVSSHIRLVPYLSKACGARSDR